MGYPGLPGKFQSLVGLLLCEFYIRISTVTLGNHTLHHKRSRIPKVETARSTTTIPTPFTSLITMGAKNGRLSNSDIKDLEKSTYFNRKELRKWYKDFIKDCPSGRLKKEEFQAIYKQFFPNGDPTKFSSFVFNVFDENKDGHISFKEFISALSITSRGSIDEKLEWAFSLYDLDNDGYITKNEMVEIVDSIYAMLGKFVDNKDFPMDDSPQLRVEKIFQSMDSNKDNKLSKDEFIAGSKKDAWIVKALTIDAIDSFNAGSINVNQLQQLCKFPFLLAARTWMNAIFCAFIVHGVAFAST
ncbi:Neuronal calcium sensor [Trichinella spiralis]|uniref:Neuronal calcium sensor n=1 Tax=Trichinella spiralis TaxID=6334 RepID=A0ABR3K8Z9_TRISP